MFIEIHSLQNFAPSCLNRDDTNAPKDAEFGGYRRARISSQCLKRAIRQHFKKARLLDAAHLAERSKRLVEEVATRAAGRAGQDAETARKLVAAALASVKLKADDQGETQYLLFLGEGEIDALAGVVVRHWDALAASLAPPTTPQPAEGKRKSAKQEKAAAKEAVPAEVARAVAALLDGGKAADLALFGRMLADLPEKGIDAACQVAHAVSTNKVSMEADFYTAVDDLKERAEDTGAGMMGIVEFNSACFYRYANIDLAQLEKNLQGDGELARRTVEAFLKATVEAIPTGKQNSMAAHNPPALVLVVVRKGGLWSLANAFVQPVRPDRDGSLVANSVKALDRFWGKLAKVYGSDGLFAKVCTTEDVPLESLKSGQVETFPELLRATLTALDGAAGAQEGRS
jgi:CRISPR system Cascade subunit CasC